MPTDQIVSANLSAWPPEGTSTRGLSEDFSVMVFGVEDLRETELSKVCLLISVLTPSKPKVFDWDAAERRADWEEGHCQFAEFSDVKGLLSDLHVT